MKPKFDPSPDAVAAIPCEVCRKGQASDVLAVCKSCYERPQKKFELGWYIGWLLLVSLVFGLTAALIGVGLGIIRWATGWW